MIELVLVVCVLLKFFGLNEVLKGIEFEVYVGVFVVFCGENGVGKLILIKLLMGFYYLMLGYVEFVGECLDWFSFWVSFEVGIVVVYQEFLIIGVLSVVENIFLNVEFFICFGLID